MFSVTVRKVGPLPSAPTRAPQTYALELASAHTPRPVVLAMSNNPARLERKAEQVQRLLDANLTPGETARQIFAFCGRPDGVFLMTKLRAILIALGELEVEA